MKNAALWHDLAEYWKKHGDYDHAIECAKKAEACEAKIINFRPFRSDKRVDAALTAKYVDSLKARIISDKTNSEGRFRVELKNAKYWVFALSTRKVSDSDEKYLWLFEYTPDEKPLYLSNDNMVEGI